MRIGIDLMGSLVDPEEAASAINEVLDIVDGEFEIYAVSEIALSLQRNLKDPRVSVIGMKEYIPMDASPARAVIDKPGSTLVHGIKALQEQSIDALVTLGNTGAVIAAAKLYLPLHKGLKRPFLLASLPSLEGSLYVGDVGGTINPKLSYFQHIALINSAYYRAEFGNVPLRLGLLNIGEETTKGTGIHQEAFLSLSLYVSALAKMGIQISFLGNIEPNNAFNGSVNILITDGFTGNIFLKTAEGTAEFLLKHVESGADALKRFESSEYSGAFVAGIDTILVKCHGYSNKKALRKGIERACQAHRENFLGKVKHFLKEIEF